MLCITVFGNQKSNFEEEILEQKPPGYCRKSNNPRDFCIINMEGQGQSILGCVNTLDKPPSECEKGSEIPPPVH